jgi:hypothetical protein
MVIAAYGTLALLRTFLTSCFSSNWRRKVFGHAAGLASYFAAK